MGYTRIGYLCRHAFCIFRYNTIDRIPPHYIQPRWRRDALPSIVHSISNMYSSDTSEYGVLKNDITDMVTQCTNRLRRNPEQLRSFCSDIKKLRNRIFNEYPAVPKRNQKTANISDILNIPVTSTINVRPPTGIKTKGSGTKKHRVKPDKDSLKKRKKGKKAARHCKTCDKYVYDHDSRNCEKVRAAKLAARKAKRDADIAAGLPVLSENENTTDSSGDSANFTDDYSSDDSNVAATYDDESDDNKYDGQPAGEHVDITRHSSRFRKTF